MQQLSLSLCLSIIFVSMVHNSHSASHVTSYDSYIKENIQIKYPRLLARSARKIVCSFFAARAPTIHVCYATSLLDVPIDCDIGLTVRNSNGIANDSEFAIPDHMFVVDDYSGFT